MHRDYKRSYKRGYDIWYYNTIYHNIYFDRIIIIFSYVDIILVKNAQNLKGV